MADESTALEVATLVVALLTPLLVLELGRRIQRDARRAEQAQWSNQKIIERRLELHAELAPKLNDLYCTMLVVGGFRQLEPPEALKRKRELDQTMLGFQALFSTEVLDAYRLFIKKAFLMGKTRGEDARFRSRVTRQRSERTAAHWKPEWAKHFLVDGEEHEATTDADMNDAYQKLNAAFRRDFGSPPDAAQSGV